MMAGEQSQPTYEVSINDEDRIIYVRYCGHVTSETTIAVYIEFARLLEDTSNDITNAEGCLFDFSEVTHLEVDAMATAARKSVSFRLKNGHLIAALPTALVIKTPHQEVMVSGAVRLAHQTDNPRLRVVKSVAAAKQFFSEFNRQKQVAAEAEQTVTDPQSTAAT